MFRFLLDGQPVSDGDTKETLEIDHDDVIEVFTEQTGGAGAELLSDDDETVNVRLKPKIEVKKEPCRNMISEVVNRIFRLKGYKKFSTSSSKSMETELVSYCTKDDDVVKLAPLGL